MKMVYIESNAKGSQQQGALSGRVDMSLSSAVKAFGSLCLLLVHGAPVSKMESPKIIGPDDVKIKAHPGEQLFLHCEAFAGCKDETIIYWLVNDNFPEDLISSSRIVETEESTLDGGAILKRSLMLRNVTTEDLKSTFTCVVMNSAGTTQKKVSLVAKVGRHCTGGRKRKN